MANLTNSSWGETPLQLGDAGGVVTWSLPDPGAGISEFPVATGRSVDPDSFLSIDYRAIISQAFADWSAAGNIEFMQIEDQGGDAGAASFPDIRIFFGAISGNFIGWAFFPTGTTPPSPRAGDILLENSPSFNSNVSQFTGLVLHEIGHALGLDHVPNGSQSVMTPTIRLSSLQRDDIMGIRSIYGPQDNAPPVYTMPNDMFEMNILEAPSNITVNGNARSNHIDGTSIAETFNAGDGADTVLGRDGFDTITGGNGADVLDGGNQADLLRGGTGNDNLSGGQGFDLLYGDAGSDILHSGADPDRLFGGDGNDQLFAGSNFSMTVDGLFGEAGNDTLFGEAGFDFLDGGTGNDLLDGGHQADNLYGRAGNDTLRGDLGFDRLFGGTDNDLLRGGAGDDALFGEAGDDSLYGEGNNDRLFGGSGDDYLDGGERADNLIGGAGFDTLVGGTGNDVLQGNFNADRFVFVDGHGDDVVTDFDAINSLEKLDLRGVSAITNFSDFVTNHATQNGGDVLIDTGAGNSILLRGVSLSDLDPSDFLF